MERNDEMKRLKWTHWRHWTPCPISLLWSLWSEFSMSNKSKLQDVSSKKKSQNWTEPKPQRACKTLFSKTDFLTLSYNLVTSRQEQKTRRWVSIANSLKHSEKIATERRHGCYTRTMGLGWSGMAWICFALSIFTLMSLRGSHFGTGFVLYPDWP